MSEIIENGAGTAAQEQVADAGGQQEMMDSSAMSLSEFLSDAQDGNAEGPDAGAAPQESETVEKGDDGPAAPQEAGASTETTPKVFRTQAEFDAAFSKRMANERARNRPYVEMGREVMNVAGEELSAEEVRAAISHALAEKRSKANSTDYDTEMNNIRVEQRIAQRYGGQQPAQQPPAQAADDPGTRAREMIAAMEAIGDEAFSVAALQGNQEAMEAWAGGATPAQVYRQFFLGAPQQTQQPKPAAARRPAPERAANSGATGAPARKFSSADIDKIDKALEAGKSFYL